MQQLSEQPSILAAGPHQVYSGSNMEVEKSLNMSLDDIINQQKKSRPVGAKMAKSPQVCHGVATLIRAVLCLFVPHLFHSKQCRAENKLL